MLNYVISQFKIPQPKKDIDSITFWRLESLSMDRWGGGVGGLYGSTFSSFRSTFGLGLSNTVVLLLLGFLIMLDSVSSL